MWHDDLIFVVFVHGKLLKSRFLSMFVVFSLHAYSTKDEKTLLGSGILGCSVSLNYIFTGNYEVLLI